MTHEEETTPLLNEVENQSNGGDAISQRVPFDVPDEFENNGSNRNSNFSGIVTPVVRRMRSTTMSSIMSTSIQAVKGHMDKKRFVFLILSSFCIYLGFVAAFAPRTSLSRDFKRWHNSKLTTAEVYRIYLDTLQNSNHVMQHVKNYSERFESQEASAEWSLEYTVSQLRALGFQPKLEKYYPWVSKLVDTQVELLEDGLPIFKATLLEDCLHDEHYCERVNSKGFHAYSPNGDVTSQYVYCNYGSLEDYRQLLENNIDIEDKVHIIRSGRLQRGLKIKNAELYGASSAIIYTDPMDDGAVTESNGYKPYPRGPARNPSYIEKGSVEFFTENPGDPTTPGYPAKYPDIERLSPVGKVPRIPSIPMSAKEVQPFLKELNNEGFQFTDKEGGIPEFRYFSGPSRPNLKIHLLNNQNHSIVEITNVIVEIPGILSDSTAIIGSHREAWDIGTTSNPNSGSAILLEVARGMSKLLKHGWKPLRPIKLISWDGEESALIGSTEYIEDHMSLMKKSGFFYLNLNKAISGTKFQCKANPLLTSVITDAAKFTAFKGMDDWTLFDEWRTQSKNSIELPAGDEAYPGFQYHLGIPSASFSFSNNGVDDAIYHCHSKYHSSQWLENFVDPDYKLHNTMASFIGLASLMISENELAHVKTNEYFIEIFYWYKKWYKEINLLFPHDKKITELADSVFTSIKLITLQDSVNFDRRLKDVNLQCSQDYPIWGIIKKFRIYLSLLRANNKLKQLDKLFMTNRGLKDRPWMKHSIYAPDKELGVTGDVLPGLHEALLEMDREEVFEWLTILLSQFNNIRYLLR
ncbi:hypothetical protein KAFR_0E04260 [Kazachstania africana CBS 2517]|uniref:Vacuolar protein sorting-associated protein 70 n=1 Tax=Kazachstania africana (strain ATCC 22294 / BCRC 22015 / CBS 2517 / CECT 1963 / NBRC 1671 / NRRL Y-8276) TaxID=1071382 RepID=H2AW27_KAZAF|nr:hypothetical protein KAFR_0E04260 [Kazachstania africana CBS 2517]CCF58577.1 hypothetical protein KAFR_0E04260 [Kazachstania africana CBS 2517]